ncbi:MAG: hypothetical protein ABI885_19225 [Gammaproteobacteria bacterium]
MKLSTNLILVAVMATALLVGCKKQDPLPNTPEPKAEAAAPADAGAGTTTNFENPAATEPAKPAGQ